MKLEKFSIAHRQFSNHLLNAKQDGVPTFIIRELEQYTIISGVTKGVRGTCPRRHFNGAQKCERSIDLK